MLAEPGLLSRSWRNLAGSSAIVIASMCWVLIVIVCALAGSWLAPHSPTAQDLSTGMTMPSGSHWLGTTKLGTDVFSIVIAGTRTAVVGPALIAIGAMVGGSALGLIAGYVGGRVESLILRWVDFMYALPGLIVAIVVVGVIGGGYWMAVITITVLSVPFDTRVVRSAVLTQRHLHYVEAGEMLGISRWRILFREIWPNVMPLELAQAFLSFSSALVTLASLSFLGLGVAPGTPDWGLLLSVSYPDLANNPFASIGPGLAIVLTSAAVNVVGDWIYESFSDRGRAR
jgi:peptide/nickel transport system permease protein